jgi:predicted nucleic acid-binding protein
VKTLYFDTSYLFRIYSSEPGHHAVKQLLADAKSVASAWHARAEFFAIVLRKRREGAATPELLRIIAQQFIMDRQSDLISLLPLSEAVMKRVETVYATAPADTYLRAADALHLACAAVHGFTETYSNDRHFLDAAPLFGLRGVDVIPDPYA